MIKLSLTSEELVYKLCQVTNLNQKELSRAIGITAQTITNWTTLKVGRFDTKSQKKIIKFLTENPQYYLTLGTVSRNKIELIDSSDQNKIKFVMVKDEIQEPQISYSTSKEELQIEIIRKLKAEIYDLKEEIINLKKQLEKYQNE